MPIYEYRGINPKGKVVKGAIDADDLQSAHLRLKGSGIFITEPLTKEEKEKPTKEWWRLPLNIHSKPSPKVLYLMTYQLKSLLGAGLPILEALEVLVAQEENHYLKKTLVRVKEKVAEGTSLAEAMGKHPQVFSNFYTKIVATGEVSGSLEEVLEQLLSNLETQEKIRSKVVQASAYPILMTIIGVVILFFLMTSIVPRVLEVFEDTQQVLPLPTRILISVSSFLVNWWFLVLIALLGAIYSLKSFLKTDRGRELWENTLIKIPLLGRFSLNLVLYRFSKSMETLLKSGLTIPLALEITRKAVHHKKIENALKDAEGNISAGGSLSASLKENSIFPLGITHMIAVGERSGELDDAFSKVSEVYERSIETSLGGMLSLIEPLLIVIMGGLVGFIVLSILLPIFEMSQIIQ